MFGSMNHPVLMHAGAGHRKPGPLGEHHVTQTCTCSSCNRRPWPCSARANHRICARASPPWRPQVPRRPSGMGAQPLASPALCLSASNLRLQQPLHSDPLGSDAMGTKAAPGQCLLLISIPKSSFSRPRIAGPAEATSRQPPPEQSWPLPRCANLSRITLPHF